MMNARPTTGSQTLDAPEALQLHFSQQGIHYPLMPGPEEEREQPKVSITGDIRMCVSELDTAVRPIIGHYSIEPTGLQEPLYALWYAEGRVLHRQAHSTTIAFDLHGARAGETRTYLVAAQVTESPERRCIVSGVFVQILVM